jgi:hypothetical protein
MKYSVNIPKSKTKRFNVEPRLVKINFDQGWDTSTVKEHWITSDKTDFEFEVPDGFEYVHSTQIIDGLTFNVRVTYYNKDKTKEETIELVPYNMQNNH